MPHTPKLRRPLIMASVMMAMFMIAIEATIVSTAMPQIAGQLGDLHLYAWVFSSFLLTQTAMTVVFGKLSDLYGRKPVMLAGIAVFLVGSLLCGLAGSMRWLIAFRLGQGIGAGAIQPVGITIVGDLYSVQERGKIQGYLASVWGVSSVLGPLAGGMIIQHASWAWIFWLNVPIALLAAAGFVTFLHERVAQQERSIDVAGAALFTVAVASLMLALTEVATPDQGKTLLAAIVCVASTMLFVWQERRVRDPMLEFALWARRPIATCNAATLLSGMVIIGLTTFLPIYVQGVMGRSALVAGFALTMMVLGWPVGATIAAKNFNRFGLRPILLAGAALLPTGSVAFVAMDADTSPLVAGAGSIVIGLGMGFLSTAAIVIIQDSVGWAERGAATASNIFARNLGSTLGATVLGSLFNLSLAAKIGGSDKAAFDQLRQLLDHPGSVAAAATVRGALAASLNLTFWALFATTVVTLLLAGLVPSVAPSRKSRDAPAE